MDTNTVFDRVACIWRKRPGASLGLRPVLALGAFKCHLGQHVEDKRPHCHTRRNGLAASATRRVPRQVGERSRSCALQRVAYERPAEACTSADARGMGVRGEVRYPPPAIVGPLGSCFLCAYCASVTADWQERAHSRRALRSVPLMGRRGFSFRFCRRAFSLLLVTVTLSQCLSIWGHRAWRPLPQRIMRCQRTKNEGTRRRWRC